MPFYRRKAVIVPLVILSSFLAWLSYLWAVESYRPSLNQTQALTDIADRVHTFMQKNNLRSIGINNGVVLPESLRDEPLIDRLSADIAHANNQIERVSFSYRCEDKCYFTAYFFIDIPPTGTIGPYRYFQYNPKGLEVVSPVYRPNRLTEYMQYNWFGWYEEFVPSISEALKIEDNGYVYFFCEPLEQENWHFCRGEYD
ncbi:hypothetical protein J7J47_08165 [Halomonas sp. ISL-60]|uniref:hypothetical protein n=1 Tax=Halomonas sp. ISL-56 TaxID=2819149 RepID=UPI001BEAD41E|nr:hypothetical protein [Halomonas sp. ISL-56]MBT2772205.1 hypothetical protein [Halomonas sp. ISL-60]MBT2803036.1 hypothetical protein [Halomonas sp. ISL-56]